MKKTTKNRQSLRKAHLIPNDSGVDKNPRGYGSASLLEALEFRPARLEVPAAWVSQGTIEKPPKWTAPAALSILSVCSASQIVVRVAFAWQET